MEKNNRLATMIAIKEKREKYIKEKDQGLDTVINDIEYLGKVKFIQEINGQKVEEEKDIYLLIEEKDGRTLYKYYDENMELVAYEDSVFEELMAESRFEGKDQSFLKQIENIDKEGKSLSQIEAELEEISKGLGISLDEIEEIREFDLKQEIKEKEDSEKQILNKDKVSCLDIKETTKLSQNIKGETLENKLGIKNVTLPNGQKLTDGEKLAVVSTSSLNKVVDTKNSQSYSFCVIRKNGEAVPIGDDILVQDERSGISPITEELTINNNGIVNEETNVASYRIVNGNRNEFIKISNDEISGKEIKYSEYSTEKGKYVSTELETDKDIFIDDDVRQYLKDRTEGREKADNTIKRAEHQKCEEKDVTLVDNNPNNDSHVHISPDDYIANTDMTWGEYASQLGYRGEGAIQRAQEQFENSQEKNPDFDNKEIVEMTIEEANEDFRGNRQRDN